MKDFVKMSKEFILFDNPLNVTVIKRQFEIKHSYYQQKLPYWSFSASRKKNIGSFWLSSLGHFFVILGLAAITNLMRTEDKGFDVVLISTLWAGTLSMLILLPALYLQILYLDYLPKLDTIIAEKEILKKEEEDLNLSKREQFSIPALTVIYYIFSKTSGIQILPGNKASGQLLNRLFGVTSDSIRRNLVCLYKISELSAKKRFEIQKGIDSARDFFKAIDSQSASQFLDELELKLNRSRN